MSISMEMLISLYNLRSYFPLERGYVLIGENLHKIVKKDPYTKMYAYLLLVCKDIKDDI
jgi:hypothetical protein